VKKATHKKTGLPRAVKVLKKAYLSEEEQEKVMNEVEVLRNLVRKGEFWNSKEFRIIQIS